MRARSAGAIIRRRADAPAPRRCTLWQLRGDATRLQRLAQGFARFTDGIIATCIGAIDGVQIAIKKPSLSEAPNPTAYINRKGYFALNVQAVADSTGRIIWASIH